MFKKHFVLYNNMCSGKISSRLHFEKSLLLLTAGYEIIVYLYWIDLLKVAYTFHMLVDVKNSTYGSDFTISLYLYT